MTYNDYTAIYYGIPLVGFLISFIAQIYLKNSYSKYQIKKLKHERTGAEIARNILDKNGLSKIKVVETKGNLTDHYDPKKKIIRLSASIYHGNTVAAASVAAHECGHAIQDKTNYLFLKIRAAIFPLVNFSTKIGYLVIIIGIFFGLTNLALIGLLLLLAMLMFQLVTLPVEFNASTRAKKQLIELNLIENQELSGAKTMLNAAALTYVAGLITTLLQILRLALLAFGRRDD